MAQLQRRWSGINISYNTINFTWEVCEQTGPDGTFDEYYSGGTLKAALLDAVNDRNLKSWKDD